MQPRFILLALALVLAGCTAESASVEIRPVRTIVVEPRPIDDGRRAVGEVKPRYESDLSFRVPGKLVSRLADVGVVVKQGDTLATLSLSPGESGPQLLPRFLNDDHDRALASLEKIEQVGARWVLPAHGLPWEGSPQQAVKLARQIAARTG